MIGYGTKKKRTPNTWVGSYQKLPYSWFIKMAYQRGLRINHVLNGMILQEKQMFSGIWKARVATRNEWRNRLTKKTYEQMRHEKGVRRGLFRAISGEGTSDCYDWCVGSVAYYIITLQTILLDVCCGEYTQPVRSMVYFHIFPKLRCKKQL